LGVVVVGLRSRQGVEKMNKFESLLEQFKSENRVLGIDVSAYQGAIDWQHVAKTYPWISFAIAKCTEHIWQDPQWMAHARGITAAGLNLGAYSFFHPDQPVDIQIAAARAAIFESGAPVHAFLVDLEKQFKSDPKTVAGACCEFLNAFNYQGLAAVYSYDSFLASFGHALDGCNVALAAYDGQHDPHARFASAELSQRIKMYQFAGDNGITLELSPGRFCVVDCDVVCDPDWAFYLGKVQP
jgi:GH25 family lysozyme M1 (1,4-beta-N-acetylmuramidase)